MAGILAPVYVDGQRVYLDGDPKPRVAKILAKIGKQPKAVNLVHLRHPTDPHGRPLSPEETIDRTSRLFGPVYLRCFEIPWARQR